MSRTKKPETGPTAAFDLINGSLQSAFESAFKSPPVAARAYLAMQSEFLRFVSNRFNAQAELCNQLCQCGDIKEVVSTEEHFFETAAKEYAAEAQKLADMMAETLDSQAKQAVTRAGA